MNFHSVVAHTEQNHNIDMDDSDIDEENFLIVDETPIGITIDKFDTSAKFLTECIQ